MSASHASSRDDFENSSEALDALIEIAAEAPGFLGGKLSGAGWAGCTVNLVRAECADAFSRAVAGGYLERTGIAPEIHVCHADGGAFARRLAHRRASETVGCFPNLTVEASRKRRLLAPGDAGFSFGAGTVLAPAPDWPWADRSCRSARIWSPRACRSVLSGGDFESVVAALAGRRGTRYRTAAFARRSLSRCTACARGFRAAVGVRPLAFVADARARHLPSCTQLSAGLSPSYSVQSTCSARAIHSTCTSSWKGALNPP